MRFFILINILFVSAIVSGQPSVRALNKYIDQVRKGSFKAIPEVIFQDEKNELKLVDNALKHTSDSISRVRQKAWNIIKRIGYRSTSLAVKRKVVSSMVGGLNEVDEGIVRNMLQGLTRFRKEDFDIQAKTLLIRRISPEALHLDILAKLVGFIGSDAVLSQLENVKNLSATYKNKWAAALALARLNDNTSIEYILGKIRLAPIGDDFIYEIVPDLIYTRNARIFGFLEEIIQSDLKNCTSADPDSDQSILCGYRVLEYIAYSIQDFPIPVDKYGTSEIDNYEQALLNTRKWFIDNPDYLFNADIF